MCRKTGTQYRRRQAPPHFNIEESEMFEHILDHRLEAILSNSFRQRVIGTLGAMVNVDSKVFFTASDVAVCILDKAGVPITTLDRSDRREFIGVVSSILSDAYRKKVNSVYRTHRSIHPKYYEGRASFGYRIGMAFLDREVTQDNLREHRMAASVAGSLPVEPTPEALDLAERAANMLGYSELCQLELTIQARKAKIFAELQNRVGKGEKA